MKEIQVGLLGLGTVGSGVVRIITDHQERLIHQVGCPVKVTKVLVQNIEKEREVEVPSTLLTQDANEILDNPNIDVVIEVMGGIDDAKLYILQALKSGKHVVTANKDLMALHGAELLATAKDNKTDLFYEASVAGGIPILRSIVEGLSSDLITKVMGIVNGTTNFILTKMSDEGRAYNDVLKEAQQLGFAEADPTSDVEGLDAARKMTILATLGFSTNVELGDVKVKGITSITEEDIEYSKSLGYTIKLIGLAKRDGEKLEVTVEPTLLPNTHPLAAVQNEYNAVYVYGEAVGETMFYGPGAGSLPTATAVVSDLVAVMQNIRLGVTGNSAVVPQYQKVLKEPDEIVVKKFLRLHVKDEIGVFAKITSLFSERGVSFEKIIQMPLEEKGKAEIVIVTHRASLADYDYILHTLQGYGEIDCLKANYRIEGDAK
ncbi:homoserine dehydrogenase [Bacillus thuringiensis]|uniref:Homoserine dehydrogenase n=1 Tax=Bacillus thuringiensis serovar toumanoffi TaxID=180862 RepID=A0ABD5HST8_BACTU|nr:homoserine dehydrogenase [Bacillus thuringiensis]EEM93267.1 Homoserine dehydrogenase [Bacillus thuringiensis IBL 200]MCR6783426.1 homoserine dehydrogenase [Bacillus thuringiensis]MCR6861499.1 homoserine dehydrogenase [Bacillus thuringiensis]MCR6863281.1 homoserine dehydrogenase [Bacillus thuringiensis]MDW9207950.1 homoserine dehydrogenase [Bacillus thuringiensis serovar toumanoffi]